MLKGRGQVMEVPRENMHVVHGENSGQGKTEEHIRRKFISQNLDQHEGDIKTC